MSVYFKLNFTYYLNTKFLIIFLKVYNLTKIFIYMNTIKNNKIKFDIHKLS